MVICKVRWISARALSPIHRYLVLSVYVMYLVVRYLYGGTYL